MPEAYGHYRLPHNDRSDRAVDDFRSVNHVRNLTIKFVGVWDTVGALGVPVSFLRDGSEKIFGFHDTRLSPEV